MNAFAFDLGRQPSKIFSLKVQSVNKRVSMFDQYSLLAHKEEKKQTEKFTSGKSKTNILSKLHVYHNENFKKAKSVDQDEMVYYEPPYLDQSCCQIQLYPFLASVNMQNLWSLKNLKSETVEFWHFEC